MENSPRARVEALDQPKSWWSVSQIHRRADVEVINPGPSDVHSGMWSSQTMSATQPLNQKRLLLVGHQYTKMYVFWSQKYSRKNNLLKNYRWWMFWNGCIDELTPPKKHVFSYRTGGFLCSESVGGPFRGPLGSQSPGNKQSVWSEGGGKTPVSLTWKKWKMDPHFQLFSVGNTSSSWVHYFHCHVLPGGRFVDNHFTIDLSWAFLMFITFTGACWVGHGRRRRICGWHHCNDRQSDL